MAGNNIIWGGGGLIFMKCQVKSSELINLIQWQQSIHDAGPKDKHMVDSCHSVMLAQYHLTLSLHLYKDIQRNNTFMD